MIHTDFYSALRPPAATPDNEICRCEGIPPIKLMYALSYNPLHCVVCNLEVAPASLPLNERLIEAIVSWRNLVEAIDHLWLDSGDYEEWAKQQLVDINSPVNQRGLALCKELSGLRRCYYWYFQDQSCEGFEPITHCPNCDALLIPYPDGLFRQLICEPCRIITVGE
jgi:predicted  nucleic acid-binding Zn ribbon protein